VSKAFQKLGALGRQRGKLSRNKLDFFNLNMIRLSIEYGSVAFSNCSLGDARRLDDVQRRAFVLCSGAMRRTSSILLEGKMGMGAFGM